MVLPRKIAILFALVITSCFPAYAGSLNVNYSRYKLPQDPYNNAKKIVSARDAVKLMNNQGINRVKLFAPGPSPQYEYEWFLPVYKEDMQALEYSGIDAFVGIPNGFLFQLAGIESVVINGRRITNIEEAFSRSTVNKSKLLSAIRQAAQSIDMNDTNGAQRWVDTHLRPYRNRVNISILGVGNEPFGSWHHGLYDDVLAPAVAKLKKVIKNSYSQSVKLTVPFANSIVGDMTKANKVLRNLDVFTINIYPYVAAHAEIQKGSFKTTQSKTDWINFSVGNVTKGDFDSPSLFHAMLKDVKKALNRTSYSHLPIVIGETGWPSRGDNFGIASTQNAKSYLNNLKRSASSLGVRVYFFELFDEAGKSNEAPSTATYVEPHWGIYAIDKNASGFNAIKVKR